MGFGFAVFGWLQVLSAVALIARPSKKLLEAVIALNVAALAAWLLSRTAGLPFGAHAGEAEEIFFHVGSVPGSETNDLAKRIGARPRGGQPIMIRVASVNVKRWA